MTHTLNIVYNNGTLLSANTVTIPLNGSYTPSGLHALKLNLQRYVPTYGAGDEVSESVSVIIEDSNATPLPTIRATIRDINLAFSNADERQKSLRAFPVYLQFQPDGQSDVYRSEVTAGKVDWNESTLMTDWNRGKIKITIAWTRKNFWEDTVERAITVTNANGSDDGTNGLNVYAVGDLNGSAPNKRDNSLSLGTILGDLPSPLRLEMKCVDIHPGYANTIGIPYIRISNNVFSDPDNLIHDLNSEGGTGGTQRPASIDLNKYSGGYYREFSLTTTEQSLWYYVLSSNDCQRLHGNYFIVLGSFSGALANCKLRIGIQQFGAELYRGPFVTISASSSMKVNWIIDLIQLPVGIIDLDYQAPITIVLYGKSLTGTPLLGMDCLLLMPTDGFLSFFPISNSYGSMVDGEYTIYDGGNNSAYYERHSGGTTRIPVGKSGQITGYPGRSNKLVFNFCGNIDDTYGHLNCSMMVKAWYRPRRRTM